MDLEGHYPQNTISHALFRMKVRSHCTFFRVEFSAMPEIRADLFLAISMTGMCLLTLSVFYTLYYFGSQLTKVGKKLILLLFLKLVKISYDFE